MLLLFYALVKHYVKSLEYQILENIFCSKFAIIIWQKVMAALFGIIVV